jgi:hypothetical protein
MTRRLPPALFTRVNKMMPLLATDNKGERDAAVDALNRILQAEGYDWHDYIATRMEAEAATPRPHRASDAKAYVDALDSTVVLRMVRAIHRQSDWLNDRSRDFLADLESRARLYEVVFFSAGQWRWLVNLAVYADVKVDASQRPGAD